MRVPLWLRLATVIVVLPIAVLLATSDGAIQLLKAVDFLAPKPGLSGILLVFLAPVGFMLVVALGAWAVSGRKRAAARSEAAADDDATG